MSSRRVHGVRKVPSPSAMSHHRGIRGRPALYGALIAVSSATCAVAPSEPAEAPPERVLFIGNSLTYTNDLPGMVEALARAGGHRLTVASLTGPGFGLEDHWDRPETHATITGGSWDVVVLQQGPSALEESRVNLRHWAAEFAPRIRAAGARPALYMVWPSLARAADFPRVSESYRLAAEDVDGVLLPAGDAWQEAWRLDPSLQLYGPDEFHPSVAGTYLAALTIVGRLYDTPLTGLPATLQLDGGRVSVPAAVAARLQEAATHIIETGSRSSTTRT